MPFALVCALSLAIAWLALAALAVRMEHLVVLYWPKVALVILERQGGGRYQQIHPALAPFAVLRFGAVAVALAAAATRQAVARVGHLIPSVISSKA